ncbi:MAG: sensor histidine kinase [Thermoleophilia bacterium]
MIRARLPRALRTRLLLAIVLGVGIVLAIITAAFNLVVASNLSKDADEIVRARGLAEVAALTVRDGRIQVSDGDAADTIETRVWIFQGHRVLRDPPSIDPEVGREARQLADGPERIVDVPGDVRLFATPVERDGVRRGTVVAAISMAPYERTRITALLASCALAVVVLTAVAAAAALILRAALRPVARMTADAAEWSEVDLDSRFAMGEPHDEITRLAATLDGLLDRLAAGMRRERRLTAEVSHELRTPLAQIRAETDLALRRERGGEQYRAALEQIRAGTQRIEATIETLIATARHEASDLPHGTADAGRAVDRAIEACAPLAGAEQVEMVMAPPPRTLRVGVDMDVMLRILQPVLENACRYARRRVDVTASEGADGVSVSVRDDGPGVAADEVDRIFEPGVRGGAARRGGDGAGAGLGLPLARRLARAAGGDVRAHEGPGGHFTVRLPPA